jgi:hypothetical protein
VDYNISYVKYIDGKLKGKAIREGLKRGMRKKGSNDAGN